MANLAGLEKAAGDTAALFGRQPRILCVDDEEAGHIYMEALLAPQGYELVPAHTGEKALEILRNERIDLVLLDINMPDMDGYEVCRRIKNDERLVGIPVVMLTGLQTKEARIRSIDSGAEDFLQKMQNHEEITARVRMLLKVKALHERLVNAFNHITNVTSFAENIIQGFDPGRFDFMASIDGIVRQIVRRTTDMLDRPLLMIVGVRLGDAPWRWHQYEYVFAELVRLPLPVSINMAVEAVAGQKLPAMVFYNEDDHPKPAIHEQLQKLRTVNVHIRNAACYLGEDLCICAVNYGRDVNIYDAAVLKNMVVQSRFMGSLAAQLMEIEGAFTYTVHALARAAEAHDEDPGNHMFRVGKYCAVLAERMGLGKEFVKAIGLQATLHDVGKIYIPASILRKQGQLTKEEWTEIKKHPVYGAKIIGSHPRLVMAQSIALNHHERWDGSGYPRGLKGEAIPIEARIANLADQYDALRNLRGHKTAYSHEEACRVLNHGDGRTTPQHFDPQVLRSFRETAFIIEEIYETMR